MTNLEETLIGYVGLSYTYATIAALLAIGITLWALWTWYENRAAFRLWQEDYNERVKANRELLKRKKDRI